MPNSSLPALPRFLIAVLTAPLAAQSFIVDVNGGPGANFVSITAAVAAVPDGSVLRVRAGDYVESVVVAGIGLTIAGDPGAAIVAPPNVPGLHVVGLTSAQTFVVRGMQLRSAVANTAAEVRVEFNQGLVFLDGLGDFAARRLQATQCDALLVSRCAWSGLAQAGATLTNCRAVLDDCSVGELLQIGGDVQLAGCLVAGRSNTLQTGGPALTMQGGTVRVLGGWLSGGFSLVAPGLAIAGTGAARITPDTQVSGASPPLGPAISASFGTMPRAATSWVTGPFYSVYASGTPGELAVLVGSVRALPQSLPGLDALWLDGATLRIEAAGVFGTGVVANMLALPTSPALTGLAVVWQVVSFAPTGALAFSNPTWLVVP